MPGLLLVAALAGDADVRPGAPAGRPASEVRAFCPASGPCAELGGLTGGSTGRTRDEPVARRPGTPFAVLQLNLCNSGFAACYAQVNNGRAVAEAFAAITALRPQVVTLNEVCRDDVVSGLHPAMVRAFPGDPVFWAFQPAAERVVPARSYRCRNGEPYGIGILGRVDPAARGGVSVFNGLYPQQADGPDELRVWLCVAAADRYHACTTHLTFASAAVAIRQCQHLLRVEIPAMRAATGSSAPVLVAGDLNLTAGGSPDVRDCVPAGYHHVGNGNVQHVIATGDLDLADARSYPMRRTDHNGWFVSGEL
ncbi:endonuclease/exonuclease/phosphatase family protein [Micromonospora sp. C28SCA-DRY-2]|uniref:endonuclease/exonuclease/phosphatase family protein n=1 Tax=Micromonospora sp. C28SCA-DRY-2 TaxID=3059522 RepID=UPI0026771A46|nr:endonuclease/exonuclease/phosphatase family protein [Micromonospora sp. C28SCA-DRY-2]MDO3704349.1 endonuclease/exonuclease/phosphatase family protein [Micromonospora sp. C28SCA-DRY-2]